MKNLVWILVIALVLVGGWMLFGNSSDELGPMEQEIAEHSPEGTTGEDDHEATTDDMTPPIDEPVGAETKEFTVTGSNFKFDPATIAVKYGDIVKITFVNSGGVHDLKIDEFNAATEVLKTAGQRETITFVANKLGSFEYYCSIGTHRQMGMKGTLTVTK